MRILVISRLDEDQLDTCLAANVVYRPDLIKKSQSILKNELTLARADAVIYSDETQTATIAAWRRDAKACSVRLVTGEARPRDAATDGPAHVDIDADDLQAGIVAALRWLEERHLETIAASISQRPTALGAAGDDVIFVGAGVTNLVAAYVAAKQGFRVRVYDAAPDPAMASWRTCGCSHGGDDARMFTLSEMDNYNDRSLSSSMNDIFNKDVLASGWGVSSGVALSADERNWISRFETIPTWLADKYNDDIFSLNRTSGELWDQWIQDDPDIFASVEFKKDVLRIYSSASHFQTARARQDRIGATRAVLSPKGVADAEPALSDAVDHGLIAGGVLVRGFTVNVHKFMADLIRRMTAAGVTFAWNAKVDRIVRSNSGRILGLMCGETMLRSSHYVISPGAYGHKLLAGTRSAGKIHGVLGAWLRLPNLAPRLKHSLKLARKGHITEDANFTIATDRNSEPILIIGSGYGHTGVDPSNVDEALLDSVYEGLIDTAKRYFPRAFAQARTNDLAASLKYCVRPWTADSLGVFEVLETELGGRLIISGGHNTGGFAQAPVLAQAILETLRWRNHPIQTLYAPDRSDGFLDRQGTVQSNDLYEKFSSSLGSMPGIYEFPDATEPREFSFLS